MLLWSGPCVRPDNSPGSALGKQYCWRLMLPLSPSPFKGGLALCLLLFQRCLGTKGAQKMGVFAAPELRARPHPISHKVTYSSQRRSSPAVIKGLLGVCVKKSLHSSIPTLAEWRKFSYIKISVLSISSAGTIFYKSWVTGRGGRGDGRTRTE